MKAFMDEFNAAGLIPASQGSQVVGRTAVVRAEAERRFSDAAIAGEYEQLYRRLATMPGGLQPTLRSGRVEALR